MQEEDKRIFEIIRMDKKRKERPPGEYDSDVEIIDTTSKLAKEIIKEPDKKRRKLNPENE